MLKGYSYDYALLGNRTVQVIDTLVNGETSNNLNHLTPRQRGTGMSAILGATNGPGREFVNGR